MAPVTFLMPAGLILAIGTAVAHHVFYLQVDQDIVESPEQQVWYSRIGLGLAFLVKTFLLASGGLAYTQLLWYTLRTRPFTLEGIDAMFAIVNSALKFSNWELWRHGLQLALMALVLWILPLVAVFTPATLTIQLANSQSVVEASVPSIDYSSISHFSEVAFGGGTRYNGPSNRVSRLMSAVTSQGTILHMNPPFVNSSYSMDFFGPSLSCGPSSTVNSLDVANIINNQTKKSGDYLPYAAFVPRYVGSYDGAVSNATTAQTSMAGLHYLLFDGTKLDTLDSQSPDYARLYVAISSAGIYIDSAIECGLYNTSYSVEFLYSNGQQNFNINRQERLNGVPAIIAESTDQCHLVTTDDNYGYCSEAMAYLSMMDALGSLLVGQLIMSHYGQLIVNGTQITKSVFMDTIELYKAQDKVNRAFAASKWTPSDAQPLSIANMSITDALEEVFLNATISLFSDSYLIQNETTAAKIPINVTTPLNVYSYEPRNLLIAYITGIVTTAIIVVIGFICFFKASSKSFGASFSDIVRTTRNPQLDELVMMTDTTGAEPMPKDLARARVRLVVSGQGGDSEEHAESTGVWTHFAVVGDASGQSVDMSNRGNADVGTLPLGRKTGDTPGSQESPTTEEKLTFPSKQ